MGCRAHRQRKPENFLQRRKQAHRRLAHTHSGVQDAWEAFHCYCLDDLQTSRLCMSRALQSALVLRLTCLGPGRYERNKDATFGAPGLTTRSKKLLVTNAHLSSISTSCFCLARVFGVKEGWFGLVSSWATQDVSSQRVMDAGRVTFAAHSHLLAPQMQRSPGRCGCSLRHGPAKCSGTAKSLGKAC